MKDASIYIMAIFYILAGLNHFKDPNFYLKMMPQYLPAHKLLNKISGGIEIILGALLLFESLRNYALVGIIALLIAVFPANIEMVNSKHFLNIPRFWKIFRLPFQGALIYWAYYHLDITKIF